MPHGWSCRHRGLQAGLLACAAASSCSLVSFLSLVPPLFEDLTKQEPFNGPPAARPGVEPDALWQPHASDVTCFDVPFKNQTCRFRNVLIAPSQVLGIIMLSVSERSFLASLFDVALNWLGTVLEIAPLQEPAKPVGVTATGVPSYPPVEVQVRKFLTLPRLQSYVRGRNKLRVLPGTTVRLALPWPSNWAHAMFDGIYPAFIAATKFGFAEQPFHMLMRDRKQICRQPGQGSSMRCLMEDAAKRLGGMDSIDQDDGGGALIFAEQQGAWLFVEDLIVGSGLMGQYTSTIALAGTQAALDSLPQLDASSDVLRLFVNRLYRAYGYAPLLQRVDSRRQGATTLVVGFGQNKRFTINAISNLKKAAARLNSDRGFNASYIEWYAHLPFSRQLGLIRGIDIFVSSTGTGLFYSVFLPDGAVVVNVGQQLKCGLPAFGEDFLGASNPRVRFWHPAPAEAWDAWREGFPPSTVVRWVEEAASLIRGGFQVPLAHPEDNLSVLGKIQRELALRSPQSFGRLRGYGVKDNGWHCHSKRQDGAAGIGDLVYELSPTNGSCKVDVGLLRKLKAEHNLIAALGLPAAAGLCDCVVCASCKAVQEAMLRPP